MIKSILSLIRDSAASLGRHVATFIPGLVVWMEANGLVAQGEEATVVQQNLDTMVQAAVSVLAVVATRLAMRLIGRWFAGQDEDLRKRLDGFGKGSGLLLMGGFAPGLLCGGAALALGLSQVACSELAGVRGEVMFFDPDSGAKAGFSADGAGEARVFGRLRNADGTVVADVSVPVVTPAK